MRQTAHALRLTSLCLFTLLSITTRPAHAGAERQLVEAVSYTHLTLPTTPYV